MSYEKRQHHTLRVIAKRVLQYKQNNPNSDFPIVKGKWRKLSPQDCGTPRCRLCGSNRKNFGYTTVKERALEPILPLYHYLESNGNVELDLESF